MTPASATDLSFISLAHTKLELQALVVDIATLFFGLALFLNSTNTEDAQSGVLAVLLSMAVVGINVWFVVRVMVCWRQHSEYLQAMMNAGRRRVGRTRVALAAARRRLGSGRARPPEDIQWSSNPRFRVKFQVAGDVEMAHRVHTESDATGVGNKNELHTSSSTESKE